MRLDHLLFREKEKEAECTAERFVREGRMMGYVLSSGSVMPRGMVAQLVRAPL